MIIATVLYIVICLLFILFSLLQQTESGGLGILGGSSNSLLGSNKASVLTRVTSFFAVIFILSALVLSILSSGERSIFDTNLGDPGSSEALSPATETETETLENDSENSDTESTLESSDQESIQNSSDAGNSSSESSESSPEQTQ